MNMLKWLKSKIGKKIVVTDINTEKENSLVVRDDKHAQHLHDVYFGNTPYKYRDHTEEDEYTVTPIMTGILVGEMLSDSGSSSDAPSNSTDTDFGGFGGGSTDGAGAGGNWGSSSSDSSSSSDYSSGSDSSSSNSSSYDSGSSFDSSSSSDSGSW